MSTPLTRLVDHLVTLPSFIKIHGHDTQIQNIFFGMPEDRDVEFIFAFDKLDLKLVMRCFKTSLVTMLQLYNMAFNSCLNNMY